MTESWSHMLKVLAVIVLICVGLVELTIYALLTLDEYPGCDPVVLVESASPTGMFRAVVKDYVCKDKVEGENVSIENLRMKSESVCVGRVKREQGSPDPARIALRWTSKNTLVVEYADGTKDFEHRNVLVGLERVTISFVRVQAEETTPPAAPKNTHHTPTKPTS